MIEKKKCSCCGQIRPLTDFRRHPMKPQGREYVCRFCRLSTLWALKAQAIAILGGKCADCGTTDLRILQIKHLNGGGKKENEARKQNQWRFYKDIIEGKRTCADLNVLCSNHNILYEYKVGRRVDPSRLPRNPKTHWLSQGRQGVLRIQPVRHLISGLGT